MKAAHVASLPMSTLGAIVSRRGSPPVKTGEALYFRFIPSMTAADLKVTRRARICFSRRRT